MADIINVYDPWDPSSNASGYKIADCCETCENRDGTSCNAENCHFRDGEMDSNYPH